MSAQNNGGPAFPRIDGLEDNGNGMTDVHCTGGMTLRDYFAAKAMQGFCAAADPLKVAELREDIAACAYDQADAMLAARGDA